MNDRPSSGQYPDPGYDGLSTTTFAGDLPYGSFETQAQGYDYTGGFTSYASASYEPTATYDATGSYDTTAWSAGIPAQPVPQDTTATGQWYAAEYQQTSFGYDTTTAEQTGHWAMPGYGTTAGLETGAYDATAWNTVAQEELPQQYTYEQEYEYEQQPQAYAYEQQPQAGYPAAEATPEASAPTPTPTAVFEVIAPEPAEPAEAEAEAPDAPDAALHGAETQTMPQQPSAPEAASVPRSARRAAGKSAGASRRRNPAKRSALLTVAVPSVCVMGVAGVAAASVGGLTGGEEKADEQITTATAPDPSSVKPVAANNKLDTQLAALSADAGDFADRASRTQERIDLKVRQDEERKKRAEEAARKEALRPKFALPVKQHGLSAGYGQSGGMWMSVHTGIDFPVSYGTPVMAATDGTVRTQYNSAYGNMAIVTSPDGTETWYCHLSSTKIRSGKVKAGDVIAYSGNSGNSTGPHLHFEVRPGGGAAIDPSSWLRSHGLNPN
ncbi:peptidase M23 [Streptomyces venezuelae]|uniref:Peptidase M23 n=1 Tax=Streptomyces venezuelae TaxID=54571 RepID=A0A5P2D3L1_STRVZ|nr:M23 family metallopeptidase [Streptomyces venezuelae]QES49735.1 peptidase M23 [Streptomyces venezuelae]